MRKGASYGPPWAMLKDACAPAAASNRRCPTERDGPPRKRLGRRWATRPSGVIRRMQPPSQNGSSRQPDESIVRPAKRPWPWSGPGPQGRASSTADHLPTRSHRKRCSPQCYRPSRTDHLWDCTPSHCRAVRHDRGPGGSPLLSGRDVSACVNSICSAHPNPSLPH